MTIPSPKIAVYGLWHLGSVTAAALAQERFHVCGLDIENEVIANLQQGKPPIFEPGLAELIEEGKRAGFLRFTTDREEALSDADVIWVAFDTPVDDEDRADVAFVQKQLDDAFPFVQSGTTILISSQVPVGFTDDLRRRWQGRDSRKDLAYCYSPENLRLGKALKSFRAEDRIVVGLDGERGRELIQSILSKFCPHLEWMSVKSAEMTKHALNSFLAVSVAMTNEIARICERTGADAKEVERGLKSESRIGRGAYVSPGGPFAGGTLARDLRFLVQLGSERGVATPLLSGALTSNDLHKNWARDAAARMLKEVPAPARVAVLGLTYKPGTDTLRRSEAVNFGLWLAGQGIEVVCHDPVVNQFPDGIAGKLHLTNNLKDAIAGSDLVVVSTGWPVYRETIRPEFLKQNMRRVAVIDQNRYLSAELEGVPGILYVAVGKPGNQTL
ncbi:MAG TPA: nucleotide sugar dehydrogenase [Terriglobia bacterium]|nr:nucleotide sugar dehydrogenase [Terriglobia bacterium]